ARVERPAPEHGASRLRLEGGPELVVPFLDRPPGSRLLVAIRADEILLAQGPITGLSARNQVPGVVERVAPHGQEAEVVVHTGSLAWIVSLVEPAVEQLRLEPGAQVHLIIKARSCQILSEGRVALESGSSECALPSD